MDAEAELHDRGNEVGECVEAGAQAVAQVARFALEALKRGWLLGELRGKNLNRDGAIKTLVDRAIYLSHAARADRRNDLVGTKFCAAGKRHVGLGDYSVGQVTGLGS